MKKLPKKSDTHAARLASGDSGVDGDSVMITFGHGVLQAMNELHQLVRGRHEKFDDDAAHILESIASGKPASVQNALVWLMSVSEEAGKCYAKTGDQNVSRALMEVRDALRGDSLIPDAHPVTVLVEPKVKKL
jgi:hypothetical protein